MKLCLVVEIDCCEIYLIKVQVCSCYCKMLGISQLLLDLLLSCTDVIECKNEMQATFISHFYFIKMYEQMKTMCGKFTLCCTNC